MTVDSITDTIAIPLRLTDALQEAALDFIEYLRPDEDIDRVMQSGPVRMDVTVALASAQGHEWTVHIECPSLEPE